MLSINLLLLVVALLVTVLSFVPRLAVPWQVPLLLVILALLVR